jgi:hypothetical protein
MIALTDPLTAARAEALFTSPLSASVPASRVQVAAAIRHAVRSCGGTRGCAAELAAAYGDHPETAVPRMRWARSIIALFYPARGRPTATADSPRWRGPTNATGPSAKRRSNRQRSLKPATRGTRNAIDDLIRQTQFVIYEASPAASRRL